MSVSLEMARSLALANLEAKCLVLAPATRADYEEAIRVLKADFEARPVPQRAVQAQDDTTSQLRRGICILDNAGLYDAADFVRTVVQAQEQREKRGIDKSR